MGLRFRSFVAFRWVGWVGVLNSNCCLVLLVIGGVRCNVVFVSC